MTGQAATANPKDVLKEVWAHIEKGEHKQALEHAEPVVKAWSADPSMNGSLAKLLVMTAIAHNYQSDYQKVQECAERAMVLAKDVMDPMTEGEAMRVLANLCWKKGEFDKGLDLLKKALDIAKKAKDVNLEGLVHLEWGTTLNYMGQTDTAEREFRESILLLEQAGNMRELVRAYNNFAHTYMTAHRYEKALEMFTKSKKIAERIQDLMNVGMTSLNRAECYAELGQYDEAFAEAKQGLSIYDQKNHPYGQMAGTHTLGLIYAKKKDWATAEEHMLKARRLAQKTGVPMAEAKIIIDIGRMFKWRGDRDKALLYFNEAEEILQKHNATRELERLAAEVKELS